MPWDMPIPYFSFGIEAQFLSRPERWLLAAWFETHPVSGPPSSEVRAAFKQIPTVSLEEAVVDLVLHSLPDRLPNWIERHPSVEWSCCCANIPTVETPESLLKPQWSGMRIGDADWEHDTQIDFVTCWVPEFDRFVVVMSGADSGLEMPLGHFRSRQSLDRGQIEALIERASE